MNLKRYSADYLEAWNEFVASSKNGTFLLNRNFMDYHSDRFTDTSLLFFEHNKLVAILPANFDEKSRTVYSHQGLTYGGLIMSYKLKAVGVMEIFELMCRYMRKELKAERIIYKPIPYIYNTYASEEDLYALYRHEAKLISRGLSTCIDLPARIPFSELRKRGLRKAEDVVVRKTDDVKTFWAILYNVLTVHHGVKPVHTAGEMTLLMSRFPDNISLYGAFDTRGTMLAGTYVFDCGSVIHTQYLAATDEGKQCGALDKIIAHLIQNEYPGRKFLDFGISTEQNGHILNEGLIFQKEGFGGRGICYDQWEIKL